MERLDFLRPGVVFCHKRGVVEVHVSKDHFSMVRLAKDHFSMVRMVSTYLASRYEANSLLYSIWRWFITSVECSGFHVLHVAGWLISEASVGEYGYSSRWFTLLVRPTGG